MCDCSSERIACGIPSSCLLYTSKSISAYYVRLLVKDEPGVLATIAGAFGNNQVSLNSVIQKRRVNGCAEIVLITHEVAQEHLAKASAIIKNLKDVTEIRNIIRVEACLLYTSNFV